MPPLVFGLWDSCKYMYGDVVVVRGPVEPEPDPEGHPVPKFFGAPDSSFFILTYNVYVLPFTIFSCFFANAFAAGQLFERSPLGIIHVEQLNAIFHDDGFGNPSQINHPRAAHNLLGYVPEYTSFTTGSTPTTWIGGPTPDPSAIYALFKQYGT